MIETPQTIEIPLEVAEAYETLQNGNSSITAQSVLLLFMVKQFTRLETKDEAYRNGLLDILGKVSDRQEKLPEFITPLAELVVTGLFQKSEPYLARIASALEVQNQLRTSELWDAHKQNDQIPYAQSNAHSDAYTQNDPYAQDAYKETDVRIVKNDPVESVPESVRNEYSGTVGKSLDERIREYTMKHPGKSVRKTAKALSCSPASVQRWKDKNKLKDGKYESSGAVMNVLGWNRSSMFLWGTFMINVPDRPN
jgi:hypothetical protein